MAWHYNFLNIFFIRLILGQDIIYFDDGLYEGSPCRTTNGHGGRCALAKDCPEVSLSIAVRPCGFKGSSPLVCCPTVHVRTVSSDSPTSHTTTTSVPVTSEAGIITPPPEFGNFTLHPDIVSILLGIAPAGSLPFGQDPGPSDNIIDAQSRCGTNAITRYIARNLQEDHPVKRLSGEMLLNLFSEELVLVNSSNDESLLKIRLLNRFNYVIQTENLNVSPVNLPLLNEDARLLVAKDLEEIFIPDAGPTTVLGAVLSVEGEWPWMVLVGEERPRPQISRYPCDGAVIDPKHIITAAHCVDQGMNTVIMGVHDLNKNRPFTEEQVSQFLEIEEIFIHPEYIESKLYNNIAVVRIKTPLDLRPKENAFPAAVCLPGKFSNKNDYGNVTITTWGETATGETDILRTLVDIPVVPNPFCQFSLRRLLICPECPLSDGLPDSLLCVGDSERGQDHVCQGSTGGIAVAMNPLTGRWTLIGLLSSIGCNVSSPHGVLTDIQTYMPWIKEVTNNLNLEI